MSLRVRTRQSSTELIEVRSDSSRFLKMELTNGQVNITFALEGESGFILSGRIVGFAEPSYYKIIIFLLKDLFGPYAKCVVFQIWKTASITRAILSNEKIQRRHVVGYRTEA